jgi:hypothetical protein
MPKTKMELQIELEQALINELSKISMALNQASAAMDNVLQQSNEYNRIKDKLIFLKGQVTQTDTKDYLSKIIIQIEQVIKPNLEQNQINKEMKKGTGLAQVEKTVDQAIEAIQNPKLPRR